MTGIRSFDIPDEELDMERQDLPEPTDEIPENEREAEAEHAHNVDEDGNPVEEGEA